MSKPLRFRYNTFVATCLVLLPGPALANQDPAPAPAESTATEPATFAPGLTIPLHYQAQAPCPDRDAFLIEVRRRISDSTPAAIDSISVEIDEQAGRFNGKLRLEAHSGEPSTRSINGERCDEVAAALALITALALQAKLPSEQPEPAETPAPPVEPVPEPQQPTPTLPRSPRFELGAQLGGASAYSPNPSLTLRAFVAAVTRHALFRLNLGYATSVDAQRATGNADFSLLAARGDICALLDDNDPLTLGLCGAFELGYLRAAGTDSGSLDAQGGGMLWAAPALIGQLRYAPSASFRLELGAGAHFPLYREQFIFRLANGSDDQVHEIPGVGWLASLGVAYVLQ